jgi:hypothetical protein
MKSRISVQIKVKMKTIRLKLIENDLNIYNSECSGISRYYRCYGPQTVTGTTVKQAIQQCNYNYCKDTLNIYCSSCKNTIVAAPL